MTQHLATAAQTYRRIEFEARIEGADGITLTQICLEQAIHEINRAEKADLAGDRYTRVEALNRASSAIAALGSGIDKANPLREALTSLYSAAESAVRAAILNYRQPVINRVRDDLRDILKLAQRPAGAGAAAEN